jgi:hypothetical protein
MKVVKYDKFRNVIRTFDRLSWCSNTPFGAGIRLVTKQPVNHEGVAIYFERYGRFNRDVLMTAEAMGNGFDLNRLSIRIKEQRGYCIWYPLRNEFADYRDALGAACLSYQGTKYDWESIWPQAFRKVNADSAKMFCSEAIYLIGKEIGLPTDSWSCGKAPQPGKDMDKIGWWEPGGYILIPPS